MRDAMEGQSMHGLVIPLHEVDDSALISGPDDWPSIQHAHWRAGKWLSERNDIEQKSEFDPVLVSFFSPSYLLYLYLLLCFSSSSRIRCTVYCSGHLFPVAHRVIDYPNPLLNPIRRARKVCLVLGNLTLPSQHAENVHRRVKRWPRKTSREAMGNARCP